MAPPKGHPKWGGEKKGHRRASSATKDEIRARIQARVAAELDPILDAQIAHAQGVSYMMLRMPDGTYTRATNVDQLDAAISVGALGFQIFTQTPHTPAATDLLNRAADKPAEQPQQFDVNMGVSAELLAWLDRIKARNRGKGG